MAIGDLSKYRVQQKKAILGFLLSVLLVADNKSARQSHNTYSPIPSLVVMEELFTLKDLLLKVIFQGINNS